MSMFRDKYGNLITGRVRLFIFLVVALGVGTWITLGAIYYDSWSPLIEVKKEKVEKNSKKIEDKKPPEPSYIVHFKKEKYGLGQHLEIQSYVEDEGGLVEIKTLDDRKFEVPHDDIDYIENLKDCSSNSDCFISVARW